MQSGIPYFGLLGLVHLKGMVDVLRCLAELILPAKQSDAQKRRLYIVRSLPELLVYKFEAFCLIVLLLKDLVGLLEVVIVVSFVLLGVGIDAQNGQQGNSKKGNNFFYMRERVIKCIILSKDCHKEL